MKHTYNITAMTCPGCQAKVQKLLSRISDVKDVSIDLKTGIATIDMERQIPATQLKEALKDYPKYELSEVQKFIASPLEDEKTWFQTYKPILLVFGYLVLTTGLTSLLLSGFSWMDFLNRFMAGFFLVFSFFKLLNLKDFAESYAMYDIIARKWPFWGYIYAFIELSLGILYLTGLVPLFTYAFTFLVMGISIIGVLQSVLSRKRIRCACLGAVFNLPVSSITIIEDALMIVMSGIMFFLAL